MWGKIQIKAVNVIDKKKVDKVIWIFLTESRAWIYGTQSDIYNFPLYFSLTLLLAPRHMWKSICEQTRTTELRVRLKCAVNRVEKVTINIMKWIYHIMKFYIFLVHCIFLLIVEYKRIGHRVNLKEVPDLSSFPGFHFNFV